MESGTRVMTSEAKRTISREGRTDLELLQEAYQRQGFIVLACYYPHDPGERMTPEEPELADGAIWRVSGESSRDEFMLQFPWNSCHTRPYFYRIEAMD